jgi:uncharacterized protein YjbI with pentapeptide repeats
LQFAFFQDGKFVGTRFDKCDLSEANFTQANFSEAQFPDCRFFNAIFENTNLEKADFTTAEGFVINPANNRIKKAKFSLGGLPGLLADYDLEIE